MGELLHIYILQLHASFLMYLGEITSVLFTFVNPAACWFKPWPLLPQPMKPIRQYTNQPMQACDYLFFH